MAQRHAPVHRIQHAGNTVHLLLQLKPGRLAGVPNPYSMETLIIIALVLTSIVMATVIVERGLALRTIKVIPQPLVDGVLNYHSARDLNVLKCHPAHADQ